MACPPPPPRARAMARELPDLYSAPDLCIFLTVPHMNLDCCATSIDKSAPPLLPFCPPCHPGPLYLFPSLPTCFSCDFEPFFPSPSTPPSSFQHFALGWDFFRLLAGNFCRPLCFLCNLSFPRCVHVVPQECMQLTFLPCCSAHSLLSGFFSTDRSLLLLSLFPRFYVPANSATFFLPVPLSPPLLMKGVLPSNPCVFFPNCLFPSLFPSSFPFHFILYGIVILLSLTRVFSSVNGMLPPRPTTRAVPHFVVPWRSFTVLFPKLADVAPRRIARPTPYSFTIDV